MNNKLILLALFVTGMILMSYTSAQKKKVIFFGDSITEMGVQPGGYIVKMKEILHQQGVTNYDLVGAGISGNKVYDLYLRMEDDVLNQHPDIVVIYIGVNDVWHKLSSGTGTDADKFEKFYRAIIKKLEAAGIKVALCTPLSIGEKKDGENKQDTDLNLYSNIIRKLSTEFQLPLCDLRNLSVNYMATNNPNDADKGILTRDGVHLNDTGAQLVAEALWKVIKELK